MEILMAQKTRAASSAKSKAVVKKAKSAPMAKVKAAKAKPVATKAAPKAALKAVASAKKQQPEIAKAKEVLKTVAPVAPAAPVKDAVPAPEKEKKTRSRKISVAVSATEAASALASKWNSLFKKAEQIESKPYNMKGVFEEKTAIVHKILGWGYILANRNDRLEVLFKDGIKYLISNYKA